MSNFGDDDGPKRPPRPPLRDEDLPLKKRRRRRQGWSDTTEPTLPPQEFVFHFNVTRSDSGGSLSNLFRAPPEWIELQLIDEFGDPVPNAAYRIYELFSDEVFRQGTLDDLGERYIFPIPRGLYRIEFDDIDGYDIVSSTESPHPSNVVYGPGKDWCEIELIDGNGKPVANEGYELLFEDGKRLTGMTDGNGVARVLWIPHGQFQVTFLSLDRYDVVYADDFPVDEEED